MTASVNGGHRRPANLDRSEKHSGRHSRAAAFATLALIIVAMGQWVPPAAIAMLVAGAAAGHSLSGSV